MLNPRTCV
ncbi:hypothetical protein E2C01_057026 [Portunus trituberculatus]|uniref:Uncharacterized protein n=1 Tax=Portunus trituberculatus TaxID=210409 RepID=A0A5B7GZY5_PORTR|nr:hypothetical protein [Portunus trituberculatus]